MFKVIRTIYFIVLFVIATVILTGYFMIKKIFIKDPDKFNNIIRLWGKTAMFLSGAKIEIEGMENIKQEDEYLVIANHQGAFDIYLLIAILPFKFRFISKKAYFKIPLIGSCMKAADYISMDRKNFKLAYKALQRAAEMLENNKSIIIFPEGTRSKTGAVQQFKHGTMKILFMTNKNIKILPIVISGTINIMPKNKLLIQKSKIKVKILKPVETDNKNLKTKKDQVKLLTDLEDLIRTNYNKISAG